MDKGDALSAQQVSNLLEECCIVSGADMFEGSLRFALQDYREIEGRFDRIVSVGMFGQGKCEAAPSAANVEHPEARL
jgi:cyclopropane fatty-acyl-phospholipid synthase-like methyltransferase